MTVSKIALAALGLACGGAVVTASPGLAQQPLAPAGPRALSVSRDEQIALQALQMAAAGPDRMAQDSALAAARSAARSNEARYAVASYQIQIARQRGDAQLLGQAVDAMASSGLAGSEEMSSLLANQAARALQANEYQRAERLIARATELAPGNAALLADHAQIRSQQAQALTRDTRRQAEAQAAFADAVNKLQRAIEIQAASGQAVPQSWYLRGLALANDSRLGPQAAALGRGLVGAYPSPTNWRDALLTYRQVAAADPAFDLDIRRLIRASGALAGERDFLDFAKALCSSDAAHCTGNPGEAKAVLDEGVSRGMLDSTEAQVRAAITAATRPASTERAGLARQRTQAMAAATGVAARAAGDASFGHGQYAEAAELYRAALQKGGEDPNLVNTRLGAALALAGRRAEAEAAFRSVTGPRADLAGFWLAWLSRRPM
jgi:hypothetical protein